MKLKGSARGNVFQTDAKYVIDNYGKDALKKVEKGICRAGVELKYEEIRNTKWYPLGWRALSVLVIKETFDWEEKDVFAMGEAAPKNSFIVRTILRYFVSMEKTFTEAAVYWKKHYSVGELVTKKIDPEKKYLEIHLKGFKVHPCLCTYFQGYFLGINKMILGTEDVEIQEKECPFKKGSSAHKFLITWK